MPSSEKQLIREFERVLAERLPPGWRMEKLSLPAAGDGFDLTAAVQSANGSRATLVVEVKQQLEPRDVSDVVMRLRRSVDSMRSKSLPVVVSGYLSARTKSLLEEAGISYVDATGNVRIVNDDPAMFIRTEGASKNPSPETWVMQSLRGTGAARAVRSIIDSRPPFGVRELSGRKQISVATLSRVVDFLDRENLIERERRGRVLTVDWEGVIRRWALDYDQLKSHRTASYLEPRGLGVLELKLKDAAIGTYAATGAFAAQRFAPIAPARSAAIYVDDIESFADRLGLRETDSGPNVWLIEPFVDVVFEGASVRDGLNCVVPSQLAVDLLTGPGREPSQGEEILAWMRENEDDWRD